MIYAFILLVVGGVLVGGAWSFRGQRKPLWSVIVLAALGIISIAVAFWRIQQG